MEVLYPAFAAPWIVSNPIYVGTPADRPSVEPSPAPATDTLDVLGSSAWRVERDAASTGQLVREDRALRFEYALGPGRPASQYAAVVVPVNAATGFDRVQLTVRANHPMRVSVQIEDRTARTLGDDDDLRQAQEHGQNASRVAGQVLVAAEQCRAPAKEAEIFGFLRLDEAVRSEHPQPTLKPRGDDRAGRDS